MNWDEFLPHVLPSVVGCPEGLAISHVINAARTFCEGTHALQVELTLPTVAGQAVYSLGLPDGQERCRTLNVNVDGRDYAVASRTTGRRLARASRGRVATDLGPAALSIDPVPSFSDEPILVELATKPVPGAEECPDDLGPYLTDIAAGAIASLCALPKQDWTDPATTVLQQSIFSDRIATVGHQVSQGHGRSRQTPAITMY